MMKLTPSCLVIVHSLKFPGDFVKNVRQINGQSDLTSMSNFPARLTSQPDPLLTTF